MSWPAAGPCPHNAEDSADCAVRQGYADAEMAAMPATAGCRESPRQVLSYPTHFPAHGASAGHAGLHSVQSQGCQHVTQCSAPGGDVVLLLKVWTWQST